MVSHPRAANCGGHTLGAHSDRQFAHSDRQTDRQADRQTGPFAGTEAPPKGCGGFSLNGCGFKSERHGSMSNVGQTHLLGVAAEEMVKGHGDLHGAHRLVPLVEQSHHRLKQDTHSSVDSSI
eukprot:938124-Pyramimonas_sp.AAC.1